MKNEAQNTPSRARLHGGERVKPKMDAVKDTHQQAQFFGDTRFDGSVFDGASFLFTTMPRTNFGGADLAHSVFNGASFKHADLTCADVSKAKFDPRQLIEWLRDNGHAEEALQDLQFHVDLNPKADGETV